MKKGTILNDQLSNLRDATLSREKVLVKDGQSLTFINNVQSVL